jgi:hypothetical protein
VLARLTRSHERQHLVSSQEVRRSEQGRM